MKIVPIKIEGGGDLVRERLVLQVVEDADLGDYTVLCCFRAEEKDTAMSGSVSDAFWFNEKKLKAGDYVVLYSKDGTASKKDVGEERTSYFFYWGNSRTIWNSDRIPILIESSDWRLLSEDTATEEPESSKESGM